MEIWYIIISFGGLRGVASPRLPAVPKVSMPRFAYIAPPLLVLACIGVPASRSASAPDTDLDRRFTQSVQPVVATYCAPCHSGATPAGGFDLTQFHNAASVVNDFPHWAQVPEKLSAKAMPPVGMPQPSDEARQKIIDWVAAVRKNEALKHAGDPGPVLARRLSNAEYDNTIRDLTGVDIHPAKEFPVDPANQAGFDNSGESLTMSPALMSKYLEAARQVADHLVLKPDGFSFAPYPMLVETDHERYAIQRIIDFYAGQPTKFADYFEAAWRYKNRIALGQPRATLASLAAQANISPKYLPLVWQALETKEEIGPMSKLQTLWRDLPTPKAGQPEIARAACERMDQFVTRIRRHTERLFVPPALPLMGTNFQPFVLWRDREIAAHRRDFEPAALRVEGDPPPGDFIVTQGPTFGNGEALAVKQGIAEYIKARNTDPDLVVPAGQRARYEAALARFSSVFPTAFYLRERGRFYPIDTIDLGRYLGAGLHNVMGYFRDDQVLSDMILDEKGKKELDTLWQEFDFIADYSVRTWQQFVFNGGGGRGVAVTRPSFGDSTTEKVILGMRDEYLKSVPPGHDDIVKALNVHFNATNAAIRWVEQAHAAAEPRHIEDLLKFAARAYRRPLAKDERDDILAYYHQLRDKSNLTHEEAIRGSIVSLLVSPDFLYRVDLNDPAPAPSPLASARGPK